MPHAISPSSAATTPQRETTSPGSYDSIYDLHDQRQPQRALPVEANQPGTLLLEASQSRSITNPVQVYDDAFTAHALPASSNVFAFHQEKPWMMFKDQYTREPEGPLFPNRFEHQKLRYPPSSTVYENSPNQVWRSKDDAMAAVNGSFPLQQDASHWGDDHWLHNGNNRVLDMGYNQWPDGLCAVPQQCASNPPLRTPEGPTPFPSMLYQWQLQDEVPVGYYDNNSSLWQEPIPIGTASQQPEQTIETQSTFRPATGSQETSDEGKRTGNEEHQELHFAASAIVEDGRRASGRKTRANAQPRKAGKQLPQLKSSGLYFSQVTEARHVARGLDWPPREDATLPETQEEREDIVRELFAAIQDTSNIQDRKSGPMLRKRWLGKTSEGANEDGDEDGDADELRDTQNTAIDTVYKPWAKERLCWEILETTERIYREGTRFASILDPEMIKKCEKARDLTFTERIAKLVWVLRSYKSRVDKLLRREVIEEYVLCPDTLLKTSSSNRNQNDERQKDLIAGRARPDRPDKKSKKAEQTAVSTLTHSRKRSRQDPEDAATGGELQAKRGRKV